MNRRELMVLLSGAMTAPRVLCAQQKAMPVIGSLSAGSAEPAAPFVAAFGQGLGETGYVEGQNVTIEYRWAEGDYDRLPHWPLISLPARSPRSRLWAASLRS